jgi:cob(I)alamin adenosyltransferase
MKIYTKTGDDGTTSLFNGSRVPKNDTRVECYGTIDEVNSIIGSVYSFEQNEEIKEDLLIVMHKLFRMGSDLATPFFPKPPFEIERINENDILDMEKMIDKYVEELPELRNFIFPTGTHSSSMLQIARTVSRRAERMIVTLAEDDDIGQFLVKFVNRLSDYLFVVARYSNLKAGVEEKVMKF